MANTGTNNGSFYRKVSLYLDGEMTKEAERAFLVEMKTNPTYLEILSKEKNFRELIKNRLQRKSVSPALVQSIKDKIRVSR